MYMGIVNTDAVKANLPAFLPWGKTAFASTASVTAFSLSIRLPSFGPGAEVTNSFPSVETTDWYSGYGLYPVVPVGDNR